jgi:putative endonuclease
MLGKKSSYIFEKLFNRPGIFWLFSGLTVGQVAVSSQQSTVSSQRQQFDFWNLEFGVWNLEFGIWNSFVMSENNELGKQGEEIAVAHLLKLGYIILEKNWRAGRNEIDIIAKDKDFLVIIEVKTRSKDIFAEPEEAVTRDKQQALVRAANAYIYRKNIMLETRFDIISIIINKDETRITHLKDAFYPRLRTG